MREAKRRIGKGDPDDVDVIALALDLNLAVWSNDNDFEDATEPPAALHRERGADAARRACASAIMCKMMCPRNKAFGD